MSERDQIRLLMAEIGPMLDLAEVYESADGNSWTLTNQDGGQIFVEFMPDDDRLWLSADVGTPRAEDCTRLYSLLLQYNARWRETGGVRLVLDAPEGTVVQAYDMPAAQLDVPKFVTVFANFATVLGGWRNIVSDAGSAPQVSDPVPAGMIRG